MYSGVQIPDGRERLLPPSTPWPLAGLRQEALDSSRWFYFPLCDSAYGAQHPTHLDIAKLVTGGANSDADVRVRGVEQMVGVASSFLGDLWSHPSLDTLLDFARDLGSSKQNDSMMV